MLHAYSQPKLIFQKWDQYLFPLSLGLCRLPRYTKLDEIVAKLGVSVKYLDNGKKKEYLPLYCEAFFQLSYNNLSQFIFETEKIKSWPFDWIFRWIVTKASVSTWLEKNCHPFPLFNRLTPQVTQVWVEK